MKKTFTLLAITFFAGQCLFAQQARFGFQAGMTLSNIHSAYLEEKSNTENKLGFIGGIMVDKPIGKRLVFQPELNWTQKGGMESSDMLGMDTKITLNYIETAFKLLYRANGDHGFFIGGGPAIAYGVGGKMKIGEVSANIHFGDGVDDIGKPLDVSFMGTAGFLTKKGFQVSFAYNPSLISHSGSSDYIIRNNTMSLRIGYLLHSGKH